MIKKIVLAIALAIPFFGFAQSKFGIVDMQAVITAMPEYTAAQTQLEEASKKIQTEFDKVRQELDKLYADYQAVVDDKNTPQTIKDSRLQQVQAGEAKVNTFSKSAQQDLARLQDQLMAPIQQKFNDAIKAIGKEGNFTFIFPEEPGLLLYTGDTVVNVTDTVKKKLGITK